MTKEQARAVGKLQDLVGWNDAMEICKISRSLGRLLAEKVCSEEMTPEQMARCDRRDERLTVKALQIAEKHGFKAYMQGDCRGAAIYIYRPEDLEPGVDIGSVYNSIGIAAF